MKYMVTATLTISVSTDVEAPSKAAAIRIARDRPVVGLCNQCSGGDANEEWITSGELDGDPSNLKVSE